MVFSGDANNHVRVLVSSCQLFCLWSMAFINLTQVKASTFFPMEWNVKMKVLSVPVCAVIISLTITFKFQSTEAKGYILRFTAILLVYVHCIRDTSLHTTLYSYKLQVIIRAHTEYNVSNYVYIRVDYWSIWVFIFFYLILKIREMYANTRTLIESRNQTILKHCWKGQLNLTSKYSTNKQTLEYWSVGTHV